MAREELVIGVDIRKIGPGFRCVPIGGGSDDQPVYMFEAPRVHVPDARMHEFSGEPIEELRMGRRDALCTKVILGFDDSFAEVLLPDAVDDDAGGERVFGISDPFREVEASKPGRGGVPLTLTLSRGRGNSL